MKERKILKLKEGVLSYIVDHVFSNVLVIGDPHIYDARPGRRRDESFLDTILDKLAQARDIANKNNSYTIITGDFFHTKTIEIKTEFINKIIKVLNGFNFRPLVLSGNHEKAEWVITDKDALSILKNTGLVDILDGNGLIGKIKIGDKDKVVDIAIGGTCFGETIPYDLTDFIGMKEGASFLDAEEIALYKEEAEKQKNQKIVLITKTPKETANEELHKKIKETLNVEKVIWVTHHDLAFSEHYPTSRPLHPIDGVDLLINGHMHGYKKPVLKGKTQCYNPGNIVRLKIDEINNTPSVWIYDPFSSEKEFEISGLEIEKLNRIVLKYKPFEEVFNLEGKNIKETQKDLNIERSSFVNLLLSDTAQEKTDEAIFIKEMLDQKKEVEGISEPAYSYVLNLLAEVVEENIKNK